ncbi:DUF4434 domain-containing protein [Bythopirellula goksoeyrii]|nr:DUF4434 domain-containing protein [Bythopirellula goksoeyrii]
MTVIPPALVSDKVEIEIRVAVRNHSTTSTIVNLVLSLEMADGEIRPLVGTPLEVNAHGQELFSYRLSTADYVGDNKITCRVTGPEGLVQSDEWPLSVVACDSIAVPLLQVGWIDPGVMTPDALSQRRPPTEQDLRDAIDSCYKIGMTSLIISYPEAVYLNNGMYYPSQVFEEDDSTVSFDVVGTILNQASKNGQHVIVGLGRGPDLLLTWTGFDDRERNEAALAHSMKIATELWALYKHEPSFYGWYLSHEANDIAQASKSYYNPITKFLRTFEADKPVLISPSGTPLLPPGALEDSDVDIIAYQDAVGSGYVPYENTFDPQRRIETLEEVYSTYANAHRGTDKHLWTNLEIWQMDGPAYGNSYPPSFDRVFQQLEIEKKYVDVISTYTVLGYMESPSAEVELGGPKAVKLYDSYREYYLKMKKKLELK